MDAMNTTTAWRPLLVMLLSLAVLSGALAPTATYAQDEAPSVRVRLFDASRVDRVELRAVDGTLRLTTGEDANTLARLDAGERAVLGTRGGDVYMRLGQGGLYARTLRVHPTTDDAQWTIAPRGGTAQTYMGTLAVQADSAQPDELELVNAVPLEDYVASVVASEYTLDDTEGMKAMAVVARTYALHASTPSATSYDHVDHVASQVYRGTTSISPSARAATQATRGEVLTHDGRIIQAVYSASSGGHTADNEDVWDADRALPYLRGKRDPYDTSSPHARWRAEVPRNRLLQALSDHYALDVSGFRLGDRSDDGRVETIELLAADRRNRTVPSNAFRLFVNRAMPGVNLKSTLFDARRDGDRYIFEGRGFGHGVGLSQWGAHEMARRGFGYRDILSFYYTDVAITSLDEADAPPATPAPPIASTPAPEEDEQTTTRRIGW